MQAAQSRFMPAQAPLVAQGWHLERLTPPSRLYGANGMRAMPDGRILVAEFVGSRISLLDPANGELETVSATGGDIVGPDDLAVDSHGNIFVTEFMDARVSVLDSRGHARVLRGDVPAANGITFHQGRLFIDECRMDGRLMELDLHGGAPRVLLENLPLPNAMAPGPDGFLYFPLVGAGEIWQVHPDHGVSERVVGGLRHPTAVKFDRHGNIVTTQAESGEVLRIDPRSGTQTILARLDPCLDNLLFMNDRLFVSYLSDGQIIELLADGQCRQILPGGLQFPLDLACGADGQLYFADNSAVYALPPGGPARRVGWMFGPGYPGSVRGMAADHDGSLIVTTSDGRVASYRPAQSEHTLLASGLDEAYGVAVTTDGAIAVAERGKGRVVEIGGGDITTLASGFLQPMGVAAGPDGAFLVSDAGTGKIHAISGGDVDLIMDGLVCPHGIAVRQGVLYIADAGAHAIVAHDLETRTSRIIAERLPIGPPPGVTVKPLRGLPPFSGPLGHFAGIAISPDGAICFSADTEGSIMMLREEAQSARE